MFDVAASRWRSAKCYVDRRRELNSFWLSILTLTRLYRIGTVIRPVIYSQNNTVATYNVSSGIAEMNAGRVVVNHVECADGTSTRTDARPLSLHYTYR